MCEEVKDMRKATGVCGMLPEMLKGGEEGVVK